MDSISTLTLYNTIIVILSAILMIVVWRMSHQPSRYVFAAIQALTIVLMASYTFDVASPTLNEKLFWNNFEYIGLVFIPALVLIIAFQLSGKATWVTNKRILPLMAVSSFFFLALGTNNYHHLFYENVTLAADPMYSFITVRGPLFYAFFAVALSELLLASILVWRAARDEGVAQRRRMKVLVGSFMCPALMTAIGILTEQWVPSEMLVITGILLSSVLLFVGTFGFELFRLLPFTFDGTVETLKDGVLIVDEHQRLLYSNPALPGLIGQQKEKNLAGEDLKAILPEFPFRLLDDKVSSENQEIQEMQLLPGRFYDLQVSKIHNRKHTTISSLVIVKEVTERKRLEEDRRQTRELYTKIFQSSPAALVLSRLDNGHMIEVNDMFVNLSGYSREELIGHTAMEMNLWRNTTDRSDLVDLTLSNGFKRSMELKYRPKDGSMRVCNISPQRIDLGDVHCMISVIEDITEQMEIEERIRSNEEKFRTLFDHAGDGFYIADMKGSIIDANPSAFTRLGYTREELAGKGFTDFILKEDIPSVVEGLNELWATGSTFRELNGLSKDGRKIPAEINGKLITISGQKAILIISRDITERKEAERALRIEKERLDVTLNNISEGVVVTNMEGMVLLANISAMVLLDTSKDQFIGRKLEDFYGLQDPATGSGIQSAITTTLNTGLVSTTYRVPLRSGAWNLLINESASPIFEGEKMVGAVLAFHDVTVEKNLEEEIAKAARLRTVGTLAGGIAHDFNNVLTIIMGNIELTRRTGMSSFDPDKWFADVSNALERAKDLSNQLLTFSRGGAPVRMDVSIEELVNDAVSDVFHENDVHVEVKIPRDLGKVNIDQGQMKQALVHLLRNAWEAMPKGGSLEVSAIHSFFDMDSLFMMPGDYLHIQVKDSGIGIPASEVNHVFEPYFTTKRDHAGMGLAVAYSIVKAHNGHISIESDVGTGTTVHIYLPTPEKTCHAESQCESVSTDKGHLKVLVMDDEEMIRDLSSEMLEMLGHTAESVYGGREALQIYADAMASGKPFDLVVMDLTIPHGMGGKEAIVELLKMDPNAKVIVSSGYSNDPVMGDFRKFGFRYVMPKPYKMKDFESAIKHAMTD
jgi:PAS domain S-box-containing protein